MHKLSTLFLAAVCAIALSGCGSIMKPRPLDPSSGLISEAALDAKTVIDKPFPISQHRAMVLVAGLESYSKEQVQLLNFFDSVLTLEEFERFIISKGLSDQIPAPTTLSGWHKAYDLSGAFVVLKFDIRGYPPKDEFLKLQVLDPKSTDIVFEAEVHLDRIWKGTNDKYTLYPLFNELIKWLNKNKPNQ